MNKIIIFSVLFFLSSLKIFGQVKVGENPDKIHNSSVLELESTDKVLVITRVTDAQMNAIYPLEGAIVYNTDQKCVFQYSGMIWVNLCNAIAPNEDLYFDSSTNELKIGVSGTPVNLTSLVNDADSNPNNEIQDLIFDVTTSELSLSKNTGKNVNLGNIVKAHETLTSIDIEDNDNGTPSDTSDDFKELVYKDENGDTNTINLQSLIRAEETLTSIDIKDNDNGTPGDTSDDFKELVYKDENGDTNTINLQSLIRAEETLT
ncbi:MAG: hypothetical protein ACK5H1_06290, partial [Tenacibaculum sp.]